MEPPFIVSRIGVHFSIEYNPSIDIDWNLLE